MRIDGSSKETTMTIIRHLSLGFVLLAAFLAPGAAFAAESYDNCTGFIDTAPATITTQGTWCLRKDISSGISSGSVITINTNNVTLDCNDFKIGGLAGGTATIAIGVSAENRSNITVRNCNIRGFFVGLYINGSGGGGHRVENNRFDGNTRYGMQVSGDGSVLRDNVIRDTGGSSIAGDAYGIHAGYSMDILGNIVSGVIPTTSVGIPDAMAHGIYTFNNLDGSVSGNRVRGLIGGGAGTARAIYNFSSDRISVTGNQAVGQNAAGSVGLRCNNTSTGLAKDNIITGFATGNLNCVDAGGNYIAP